MKTNKIKSLKRTTKILSCILLMIFMSSHYCNSQSIQEEVEAYMQVQRKLDNFSGSILLAKDNDILFSKSYGMASYEHNVKNTPQTKFRIASMTKQFTAMAIMQLCEKGFLDINDKLSKFIPDFPQGDDITIHQLLIHTSGILDFLYTTEYQNIKTVKTPLSDIIDIIKAQPLEFSPGERTEYSNSGYVILGYIIEEVSGSSYEDYLHQNIFGPLDMGNTCCSDYNDIIINRASGYSVGHDGIINADYTDMSFADGSGWLYSTTEDLYLWDRALYTQKILSKDYMEKIFTPYNEKKGYGWGISGKNGRRKTS
ncbi:MAG: beta-lactamase family protein, partial [Bacteroidetes bacterium]|nr:beta-lactamase family protein [Bacteroidota bacterium]